MSGAVHWSARVACEAALTVVLILQKSGMDRANLENNWMFVIIPVRSVGQRWYVLPRRGLEEAARSHVAARAATARLSAIAGWLEGPLPKLLIWTHVNRGSPDS